MSTFAVFGMTRAAALEMARKKVPTVQQNMVIPIDEWEKRVQATTETIMRGDQVRQLSAAFDAPQFAQQWIDIALRGQACRGLHIRAKQVLKDEKGGLQYSPRGKKPKTGWLPYFDASRKAA